jgi:hypothetical protein
MFQSENNFSRDVSRRRQFPRNFRYEKGPQTPFAQAEND